MNFNKNHLLLYAVTDRSWLNGRSLLDDVEKAILGGATMIQLREKNLDYNTFKSEALLIQKLCHHYNIPLIINDNVQLAVDINADGVHVGQSDMSASNVRNLIGPNKILGVSTHSPSEAILAQHHGADYLGAGAVFPTGSKNNTTPISHDTLKSICNSVHIPVVAIGGINPSNILQLDNSGISGVAVISAIFASNDISASTRQLRSLSERVTGHAHY